MISILRGALIAVTAAAIGVTGWLATDFYSSRQARSELNDVAVRATSLLNDTLDYDTSEENRVHHPTYAVRIKSARDQLRLMRFGGPQHLPRGYSDTAIGLYLALIDDTLIKILDVRSVEDRAQKLGLQMQEQAQSLQKSKVGIGAAIGLSILAASATLSHRQEYGVACRALARSIADLSSTAAMLVDDFPQSVMPAASELPWVLKRGREGWVCDTVILAK